MAARPRQLSHVPGSRDKTRSLETCPLIERNFTENGDRSEALAHNHQANLHPLARDTVTPRQASRAGNWHVRDRHACPRSISLPAHFREGDEGRPLSHHPHLPIENPEIAAEEKASCLEREIVGCKHRDTSVAQRFAPDDTFGAIVQLEHGIGGVK